MTNSYVQYIGTQIGHQETLPVGSNGLSGVVTVQPQQIIAIDSIAAAKLVAAESSTWQTVSDPTQASKHLNAPVASNAPTAAAATGAGTSPPAPVMAGNDNKGYITFGTGTSAAAGAQVAVTFYTPYATGTIPRPVICPANAATAALQPYVVQQGQTGFQIAFGSAPSSSQANTTYAVTYLVIG